MHRLFYTIKNELYVRTQIKKKKTQIRFELFLNKIIRFFQYIAK